MEFFPEIAVNALQAEAIARGLYGVATVDGVHERELALITEFYQEVLSDEIGALGSAGSLQRLGAMEPMDVADLLTSGEHRELFVKASFLLAWADGKVTDGERKRIGDYAGALGVGVETQARLEAGVKDFLLRPLANLANVEAASAVAKKLGV